MTGGSGLVGAPLIRSLLRRGGAVAALDRSGALGERFDKEGSALNVVRGDLLRPESYSSALTGVDTVLHLAAATGNADKDTHFRVNTEGTKTLLRHARAAGVQRFLFVSSIAAKFRDKTRYFYAQSKELAEEAVSTSGIDYLIIRPTIIAGPGSGVLMTLQRLATLPLIPVPGTGRAKVQPIYVDDLVERIVALGSSAFEGQTIELGGPEVITVDDLLRRIRQVQRGTPGRLIHFPLSPIRAALVFAESLGIRRLPVTPGQLASFRLDGVADSATLPKECSPEMKSLTQMLQLSLAA